MAGTTEQAEIVQAREAALRILAHREHTERELRKKLACRGFASETVDSLVGWLRERDYLCERRFAELYIRQRARKGYAVQRVFMELISRGVDQEVARSVLSDPQIPDSERVAGDLARKKAASGRKPGQVYSFLRGRGFSHSLTARVLAEIFPDTAGDSDACQ